LDGPSAAQAGQRGGDETPFPDRAGAKKGTGGCRTRGAGTAGLGRSIWLQKNKNVFNRRCFYKSVFDQAPRCFAPSVYNVLPQMALGQKVRREGVLARSLYQLQASPPAGFSARERIDGIRSNWLVIVLEAQK
jgi:hypothetical protein